MSEALLKEILSELRSANSRLENLEKGQARLEARVANLEEGQARLEARVANLEEGQARLETKVANLEEGQARLEARLANLEVKVAGLEEGQARFEAKVAKLEVRLEREVIEHVRALHDGFLLRGDQIESLREHLLARLNALAQDMNFLIAKTARHENVLEELKARQMIPR